MYMYMYMYICTCIHVHVHVRPDIVIILHHSGRVVLLCVKYGTYMYMMCLYMYSVCCCVLVCKNVMMVW